MQTSELGRDIIKIFEGCMQAIPGRPGYYTTYRDEVGVLTIGFGHTNLGDIPPHIVPGVVWSAINCDEALSADLVASEQEVHSCLHDVSLTQNQFDALVSFEFNTGHLRKSSIPQKIHDGDIDRAVATLLLYDHAGGQILPGLTRRRECEAALFRGNLRTAASIADLHDMQDEFNRTQTSIAVPELVEPVTVPNPTG